MKEVQGMPSGRGNRLKLIDTLLFYLRYRYLSATECLVYLLLYFSADRTGCGYVNQAALSKRLGRSRGRCRSYLNRLKRHGLIDTIEHDACGGANFTLEIAVIDSETARNEGQGQSDVENDRTG
jgi:hypothetical protein